jgi:hypothetical protein
MARPSIDGFGAALPLYVLGALFLVPLTIGVVLVSNSADQDGRAKQISRDLVSMYAQGLDLSQIENRNLAMRVAQGLGLDGSRGVVILTKIRVVGRQDCDAGRKCANDGHAVVTQRYVLGNAALRSSSFGTPTQLDPATGDTRDWANDVSARVDELDEKLLPGESTFAAECYLTSSENRPGVYSRVMF